MACGGVKHQGSTGGTGHPFHPADLAVSQMQAANRVLEEFARGLGVAFLLSFIFFLSFPWFNVQGRQGLFCQPSFVMAPGECLL